MATNAMNPAMDWTARSLNEEWKIFQQHCELMFQGPLKKTNKEERAAYVLLWVGPDGRKIFNALNATKEEGQDYEFLFRCFSKHTEPQKNNLFSRYVFHSRSQSEDEPFAAFATELRNLIKDCNYDNPDEMVRDRLVAGIINDEIREKLLNEGDELTMNGAIKIATNHEATKSQLKSMASCSSSKVELDAIRKKSFKHSRTSNSPTRVSSSHDSKLFKCKNCGNTHSRKECPAFGKKCRKCNRQNHFEKVCMQKKLVHELQYGYEQQPATTYFTSNEYTDQPASSDEWEIGLVSKELSAVKTRIDN